MSAGGRVVVVGGGLAGITAALDCAAAGADVTLLEVRRRLGGAAYSFERDGLEMDNGQHVFLRCCLAYRALLARLGSEHLIEVQPRLRIPVLKPGAAPFVLRRGRLPAPLQLSGALARYPHLSARERAGAVRAALALMRGARAGHRAAPERPGDDTLGQWLARHGQGPRSIAALWDLIALPTLNIPAADASLELGAFVFRRGLLDDAAAGDIGFHRGTLSQIIAGPAARALSRAGVDVRFGWRAERVQRTTRGFEVHGRAGRDARTAEQQPLGAALAPARAHAEGDDDGVAADVVVVAVPHTRAARMLEGILGEQARRLDGIGTSPIVNLHVVYDREVCDEHFAAGVGTPVQYLFDRSVAAGAPAGSQYLAVSLSGAEREMGMSVDALRERYLPALRELLPRTRQASVERFMVTREHAATFRATPGTAALRPGPATPVPRLVLAGAWTATGWPATLEGAVLSGHAAGAAALRTLGLRRDGEPAATAASAAVAAVSAAGEGART